MHTVLIDPTLRRARIVRVSFVFLSLAVLATMAIFARGLRAARREPPSLPMPRRALATAGRRPLRGQRPIAGRTIARTRPAPAPNLSLPLPAAPREVIAFLEPTIVGALESLDRHADIISQVAATGFLLTAGGRLDDRLDPRVLEVAHVRRLPVSVLVQNLDESGWRPDRVRSLRQRRVRERLANAIEERCAAHSLAGVHLDFEEIEEDEWTVVIEVVRAVSARLKPRGLEVAVDVPPFLDASILSRLGRAADRVVVMAYDEHDEEGPAGPIASEVFVDEALASARVLPAGKLTAGFPIYGYDWIGDEGGDPLSFVDAHAAAKEAHVRPTWDPPSGNLHFRYSDEEGAHEIWMTDAATLANQVGAALRAHVQAVALWRLGGEDPGVWKVLESLADTSSLIDVEPDTRVQNLGDGPFLSLSLSPESGRRAFTVVDGRIVDERWERLPSSFVVRRAGIVPGKVALTFDDGPDERFTPAILDILARTHAPATFFVVGTNVVRAPQLVRRAFADGHQIGNHSFTHPDVDGVSDLRLRIELEATSRLVETIIERRPLLYRPPSLADIEPRSIGGARAFARAGSLGYLVVDADIDPRDWESPSATELAARILDDASGGGVILLHDGGSDRSTTVAALPEVIRGLRESGLDIVPLGDLVGKTRDEVMPARPPRSLASATAEQAVFRAGSKVWSWSGACLVASLFLVGLRTVLVLLCAAVSEHKRMRRRRGPLPSSTVVVPAFNERAVIERTVESVLASDVPVRVLVVDDGSVDGTSEVVEARFAKESRVRVLRQPNGGKASALRAGFAAAQGEIVVALDGDTLFAADTVRRLLEPFLDTRVAAVAGTAEVGNVEGALTACQALEYMVQQEVERRAWDAWAALPIVPGAVGAWRRSAVAVVGGFSSDTLAEDADLAMALCRAGFRVVHAPLARARTEAPDTVRDLIKQRIRWSFGVLQAIWKHRGALWEWRSGAFGRVVLPAMILFQILIPLITPLALVALGAAILAGNWQPAALASGVLFATELAQVAAAAWFARRAGRRVELCSLLWLLPTRFLYRPILLAISARSLARMLDGIPLGWGKLMRRGSVAPAERSVLELRRG